MKKKNINLMLFNEIDNFIEVYNNLVIELVKCFETSFFGRIDHLASSLIKFRPKNLQVSKYYIRSIIIIYFLFFISDITSVYILKTGTVKTGIINMTLMRIQIYDIL